MSKPSKSIFFCSISYTVGLLILTLAIYPETAMAFTRTNRVGLLPLRLATVKPVTRPPLKRWKTTGRKRNIAIDCSDKSQTITVLESMSTMTGWTVREAIDESIERMIKENVTEPDYSALYLMAASLELPWERGIRDLDNYKSDNNKLHSAILTPKQASSLENMLKLRESHEPIQYVLGQWDFLDYTIAIRKPLLCPRPETEELVMRVASETKKSPVRILDVGCGTGVIGISLAEMLEEALVEAIDVEPIAIETSTENAHRILTDRCGYYKATLASAFDYKADCYFDVVVSNPPYIPRSDMDGLSEDVTRHESDTALCGGMDGMDVIKTIIQKLPEWCSSGAVCWMEVDPTHPKVIEEFLEDENEISGSTVRFDSSHKDMFGKERFVKLRVE